MDFLRLCRSGDHTRVSIAQCTTIRESLYRKEPTPYTRETGRPIQETYMYM